MDDEALQDRAKAIVMPRFQMRAGFAQPLFKLTGLEELLKDDQTREGGQLLLFKLQGGQTADLTINRGLSYLHLGWPLFQVGSCSFKPDPTLSGGRLPSPLPHSKPDFFETEGSIDENNEPANAEFPLPVEGEYQRKQQGIGLDLEPFCSSQRPP